MIKHLNEVNDVKIYSCFDEEFKTFGRVVNGYDFSELINYMENIEVPKDGNIYVASDANLESFEVSKEIEDILYGGMKIQIGYCNGKNETYNGFEYHKSSEINIAVTDFILVLGHVWDIGNNTYKVGKEKVFFIKKGTAIEMYQTTLHLSPIRTNDSGFKDIVILPKGTNTPNVNKEKNSDPESIILLETNKWVIAHKDRLPLINKGAYPGLIGENKKINY